MQLKQFPLNKYFFEKTMAQGTSESVFDALMIL